MVEKNPTRPDYAGMAQRMNSLHTDAYNAIKALDLVMAPFA